MNQRHLWGQLGGGLYLCGFLTLAAVWLGHASHAQSQGTTFTGNSRSGPRNLDSGFSESSIVFQAAVPKPVVPKYTTSGVRRPRAR